MSDLVGNDIATSVEHWTHNEEVILEWIRRDGPMVQVPREVLLDLIATIRLRVFPPEKTVYDFPKLRLVGDDE